MVIEVKNLVKRYKELVALDHFNLDVIEGEIVGLLGPNGCGKTTCINTILGILTYDKGDVKIFNENMTPASYHLKKNIGYVPQDLAYFDTLNVYENIDYFANLYLEGKENIKNAVEEAIDFVGLKDYKKFLPNNLSGGLKRRLNIACGIVHSPKLLILDEPTVAVDAQSRNFILNGIKKLNSKGTTILYTTHYLEEVEELCTRIVIMDKGKNVAVGSKEELKDMIATKEIIEVEILDLNAKLEGELKKLPHLIEVIKDKGKYTLNFEKGTNNLSSLISFIEKHNLTYQDLYTKRPSLNEVFLELTGKELRD